MSARPMPARLSARWITGSALGVLVLTFSLAGCASGDAGGAGVASPTATAESGTGVVSSNEASSGSGESGSRQVTITAADLPPIAAQASPPADAPARIVSLATGVGETLVALGATSRVVGRDETSEVPADAEVVTKAHEVSAEKVLSLDPDLVLIDARTSPPEAIDQIRGAGVRVVEVPEAWTLDDMAPRTQAVADALGTDAAQLLATLPQSTTTGADGPRVAFLYLRGTSAIYLLGGAGSGADAMITAAGGIDVGAEAGLDPFVPLTAESLVALNPDVLLVMTKGLDSVNGVDGLVELPGVAQTNAGRDRRVIAVEDEILLSFGPRTGALVDLLREAMATVSS